MTTTYNLPAIQAQLAATVKAKLAYWDEIRNLEQATGTGWTQEQSDRAGNALNIFASSVDPDKLTETDALFFLHRIGINHET